jgi:hypothetical protein
MNPLASHWLRMSAWLFLLSPVVALLVALSTDSDFMLALIITLYIWAGVCVILALFALVGLAARLFSRGMRALRR